jgi:hypothetical protein
MAVVPHSVVREYRCQMVKFGWTKCKKVDAPAMLVTVSAYGGLALRWRNQGIRLTPPGMRILRGCTDTSPTTAGNRNAYSYLILRASIELLNVGAQHAELEGDLARAKHACWIGEALRDWCVAGNAVDAFSNSFRGQSNRPSTPEVAFTSIQRGRPPASIERMS